MQLKEYILISQTKLLKYWDFEFNGTGVSIVRVDIVDGLHYLSAKINYRIHQTKTKSSVEVFFNKTLLLTAISHTCDNGCIYKHA